MAAGLVGVAHARGRAALWSPHGSLIGASSDVVERIRSREDAASSVGRGPRHRRSPHSDPGPGDRGPDEVRRPDADSATGVADVTMLDLSPPHPPPRWVWWSATTGATPAVEAGVHLARCWDIAEVHRVLHGGWEADPPVAWALAHGLDPGHRPAPRRGDLFDLAGEAADEEDLDGDVEHAGVILASGHLNPCAVDEDWLAEGTRLVDWAAAAYRCAERQAGLLERLGPRALATAHSESAAALLCLELQRDGLPLNRAVLEGLIREAAGERATSPAHAARLRAERDAIVLAHVPRAGSIDLRNPMQVRDLLAAVGVVVPSTRKGVLEAYREVHPVVPALLTWRARERIATTYGYAWLEQHVGGDDRLRGEWTASDGAAGRMTAQAGLHNLPATLRPAVEARPGHVFVRADLGQIEPRVLAALSGDPAFAAATRAGDLYAPVARDLGVDRPTAKIAVLSAMYGGRSGAAREALTGLERAYPEAMAHLERAYAAGVRREPIRTFGGRLVRTDVIAAEPPSGDEVTSRSAEETRAREAARGRFARNALVQGSAAELFKAWAATVRATTRDLDGRIVLCLHDELLLHVHEERATEAAGRVEAALTDAARRWTRSEQVRFVADISIVRRWSDAKA